MNDSWAVVVPWVTVEELEAFLAHWDLNGLEAFLVLQQDASREGCAVTKNKGVDRAVQMGAEVIIVLDGDCYPAEDEYASIEEFAAAHLRALEPQPVHLFQTVTAPPSRGTPYNTRTVEMPVAASLGFWTEIGDYCAVRQLAYEAAAMRFQRTTVYANYFPLCGMNVAFRPGQWLPWCRFIDVARFDDIWMGWLWQREAYRRRHCFNLNGPVIRHARQSNVWKNLAAEAEHLEANDRLWADIFKSDADDYETLRKLLPV